MQIEITQLVKQEMWHPIARKDVPSTDDGSCRKILNGTWAFKLKCLPDVTASEYKARYCVFKEINKLKELTTSKHMHQSFNGLLFGFCSR